jgi:hypothetical protein
LSSTIKIFIVLFGRTEFRRASDSNYQRAAGVCESVFLPIFGRENCLFFPGSSTDKTFELPPAKDGRMAKRVALHSVFIAPQFYELSRALTIFEKIIRQKNRVAIR